MSRPRYRWWGYVKAVIRAYPALSARLRDLQTPGVSQHPGEGNAAPGRAGRPTEALALRTLPRQEQRELEAVQEALFETAALPDGGARVKLIQMVFWRRSHTLEGAAQALHWSYGHAKRIQERFICQVAKNLGLKDEPQEPKT